MYVCSNRGLIRAAGVASLHVCRGTESVHLCKLFQIPISGCIAPRHYVNMCPKCATKTCFQGAGKGWVSRGQLLCLLSHAWLSQRTAEVYHSPKVLDISIAFEQVEDPRHSI